MPVKHYQFQAITRDVGAMRLHGTSAETLEELKRSVKTVIDTVSFSTKVGSPNINVHRTAMSRRVIAVIFPVNG